MPNARATILLVEDEAPIAETILYALRTEGFGTIWKTTGRDGLAALAQDSVSLVVLDVGLPDANGFDLCREIRRTRDVPVIFLTARTGEVDRVVGLELGADDYVAKPFSPRELTARVRAVLRRGGDRRTAVDGERPVASPKWQHDEERCCIRFEGRALELTRNEYRLLGVLLAHPGRVFSREQLMNAAWDDPGAALDRTVDAHVKTLRAKLRAAGCPEEAIATHRGFGYSFRAG